MELFVRLKSRLALVLLCFGIAVAYQAANIRALEQEGYFELPAMADEAGFLLQARNAYEALRTGGLSAYARSFGQTHDIAIRAPLVQHLIALWYVFGGVSRHTAVWSYVMYLTILLASLLGISVQGFRRLTPGILAGIALLGFPIVIAASRVVRMELPLAAFVTLSVYALLSCRYFARPIGSAGLGVALGLCLLTKTMAPVYLLGPIGYGLIHGYTAAPKKRTFWRNVLVSLFVALATASLWWVPNAVRAIGYLWHFGYGAGAPYQGPVGPLTQSLAILFDWDTGQFPNACSQLFLSLFAFCGVMALSRQSDHPSRAAESDPPGRSTPWLLTWWLLSSLPFLFLTPNKFPGWMVGLMPPLALLFGACVTRLSLVKALWAGCSGAALAVTCINLAVLTFGAPIPGPLKERVPARDRYYQGFKDMVYYRPADAVMTDRSDTDWHLEDLARTLEHHRAPGQTMVGFLFEEHFFSEASFQFHLSESGGGAWATLRFDPPTAQQAQAVLREADFIVALANEADYRNTPSVFTIHPDDLWTSMKESGHRFTEIGRWRLPNWKTVVAYKKERSE